MRKRLNNNNIIFILLLCILFFIIFLLVWRTYKVRENLGNSASLILTIADNTYGISDPMPNGRYYAKIDTAPDRIIDFSLNDVSLNAQKTLYYKADYVNSNGNLIDGSFKLIIQPTPIKGSIIAPKPEPIPPLVPIKPAEPPPKPNFTTDLIPYKGDIVTEYTPVTKDTKDTKPAIINNNTQPTVINTTPTPSFDISTLNNTKNHNADVFPKSFYIDIYIKPVRSEKYTINDKSNNLKIIPQDGVLNITNYGMIFSSPITTVSSGFIKKDTLDPNHFILYLSEQLMLKTISIQFSYMH